MKDNLTELIWLKDPTCLPSKQWIDALSSANNLATGTCGLTDGSTTGKWRLPNIIELVSLMDRSVSYPSITKNHPFVNVISYYYWSSSTSNAGNGMIVNLYDGEMTQYNKLNPARIWPVRDDGVTSSILPKTGITISYSAGDDGQLQKGVPLPTPRFSDNNDGTIIDNLTGLILLKNDDCFGMQNWSTAITSANTLASGICGLTDGSSAGEWRLPNANELGGRSGYWSSSTSAISPDKSWYFGNNGTITANSKGSIYKVLPVRSGQYWPFNQMIISVSPKFGIKPVGYSNPPRQAEIINHSNSAQTVSSITVTGPNSSELFITPGGKNPCSSLSPTIVANGNCTLLLGFNPTSIGSKSASLDITVNDTKNSIPLSGTSITTVFGSATDQSTGLPVSGVTVTLNTTETTLTGTNGSYTFGNLPAATYSITVSKSGYQSTSKSGLTVTATASAKADIYLPTVGTLNMTTTSLPWASPAILYSNRVMVAGGTAPYTFSKAYGTLPTGLSLDTTTGTINGTPTGTGSYTFAIGVTDTVSGYTEKEFTIELLQALQIETAPLSAGQQGTSISNTISASGGKQLYSFTLVGGQLPIGLTLSTVGIPFDAPITYTFGILSGTPRESGSFTFSVRVTDARRITGEKSYALTLSPSAALTLNTLTLPQGYRGTSYSTTLTASGGVPLRMFSLTGTLPTGLSLNSSTGVISGTPTAAGLTNLTFTVTDYSYPTAQTASVSLPLRIWNVLSIATTSIPAGLQKTAFNASLSGIGGATPHSWSIASGTLPQGISLESTTAALAGTPTNCGSFPITVRLTDSATVPKSVDKPLALTIACSNDYTINGAAGLAGAMISYSGTTSGTVTADGSGNYSIGPLQNGTYTVTPSKSQCFFTPAAKTAQVNNLDVSLEAFAGVLDTVAPTLSLSTLADESITNNATLNISGTVLDSDSGLKSLAVNGTSVSVATNGTFSSALTLVAGANTITTIATDNVNNQTTETRIITLDQAAPVLTVTTPPDNSAVAVSTLTVSGSVNKSASVDMKLNNGASQTVSLDGNTFTTSATLAVGLNTIDLTATDLAGNSSSVKRTVIYDNTKPTLAVTLPAQDITTNLSTLNLQGTVSDPLSATTVSITMDGQTFSPTVANDSFQQMLAFTILKQYAIVVTATDQAGNSSTVQRNVIFEGMSGDVNGDKTINVFDALLTLQYAVGLVEHNTDNDLKYKSFADVAPLDATGKPKGDGVVNVFDALAILRHAVSLDPW